MTTQATPVMTNNPTTKPMSAGLATFLGRRDAFATMAGLLISGSDYAHETLARVLPVRDAFVALFFVTIGALIDPALVMENLPLLGTMIALVVVGKLVLRTLVVRAFGQPIRTAVMVGVGLTQIGEFSFILVQVARSAGHVGAEQVRRGRSPPSRGLCLTSRAT